MNAFAFLKHYISKPGEVGSITPSSSTLANVMTEKACVSSASSVLELGPGTGAITRCIEAHRSDTSEFLAIEMNSAFVGLLRGSFPQVTIVQGSAADSAKHLRDAGMASCDSIVSSLPFASFDGETQDAILSEVLDVLSVDGRFVTFTYVPTRYLPAGRMLREKLFQRFGRVEVAPIVWKSLPPAYVYCAVK